MPALAALFLALAPLAPQDAPRELEPAAMEADLFQLGDLLEREHAGLLRFATREEVDAAFERAFVAIVEPLDVVAFQRVLAELLGVLRCGHTGVSLPAADAAVAFARCGALPLELHLAEGRAWVLRSLDPELAIEPGSELLAIDGRPWDELRALAFARLPGDGYQDTFRERQLENGFARQYALHLSPSRATGRAHTLTLAGQAEPLAVQGLDPAQWDERRTRRPGGPNAGLEVAAPGVGWLRTREFGDEAGDRPDFPTCLREAFGELEREGVERLVLDLRGNGGGRDAYGALLVAHLAREPFGYFDAIEVTADYDGPGGVVERDGRRWVTEHPGLAVQQPVEPHFDGDLWVLTDGWTFSTATDVAAVLQRLGRATFAGEETGGGDDGNTSGSTLRTVLERSGMAVAIPQWLYTTAGVRPELHGRGVIPDHLVVPTVEDVLAGRDPALELAVEHLTR